MIIENISLLITTHPPHYKYLYNLINKCINNNITIDTFLVFSNEEDYESFEMKEYITPIIVKDKLNENGIVSFKKLYGLTQMVNFKNEFIICIDSEIDIIVENFTNEIINEKINNIFNNLKTYTGEVTSSEIKSIIDSSSKLFINDYEKLRELTNNFSLYCWWSDLPVYRKSDLNNFFELINFDENKYKIHGLYFEYIIYQYYLILNCNFSIENVTPYTNIRWSLEEIYTRDLNVLNKLSDEGYGFSWISKKSFDMNPDYYMSKNTCFIYHLDRAGY